MRDIKHNIIFLGCSLGGSWVHFFDHKNNLDYHNHFNTAPKNFTNRTQGAGSNHVALETLNYEFLTNPTELIEDTTVVVQFTGWDRQNVVVHDPSQSLKLEKAKQIINTKKFGQGGTQRGIHLFTNPITKLSEYMMPQTEIVKNLFDGPVFIDNDYSEYSKPSASNWWVSSYLVANICMLAKLGTDIRVFRGWRGITMEKQWWAKGADLMRDNGALVSDVSYLDKCLEYSKDENDWIDEFHPTSDLGIRAMADIVNTMR